MELVSEQFAQRVLLGVAQVRSHLALSVPTIRAAIATLSDMQIVNELTGQRRHRVFAYLGYVLTHTIRMNIPATRLTNSSSASTPA